MPQLSADDQNPRVGLMCLLWLFSATVMPLLAIGLFKTNMESWAVLIVFPIFVGMSIASYQIATALSTKRYGKEGPSIPLYVALLISGIALSCGVFFAVCSRTMNFI